LLAGRAKRPERQLHASLTPVDYGGSIHRDAGIGDRT
jgi:hypothetical protein